MADSTREEPGPAPPETIKVRMRPSGSSANAEGESPTWERAREIPQVCLHRPYLRRTIRVALVVGTILFAINQLDVVLSGRATAEVWMKSGLTYLVPFCVSNYGVLVATHRRRTP